MFDEQNNSASLEQIKQPKSVKDLRSIFERNISKQNKEADKKKSGHRKQASDAGTLSERSTSSKTLATNVFEAQIKKMQEDKQQQQH